MDNNNIKMAIFKDFILSKNRVVTNIFNHTVQSMSNRKSKNIF
jgi:hypothetical protein